MRRVRDPALVVFVLALLLSLGAHFGAYDVLGVLAKVWDNPHPLRPQTRTAEVEFDVIGPEPAHPQERDDATRRDRRQAPQARPQARRVQPKTPPKTTERKPGPPDLDLHRHAIKQHSRNPDVEPPPDTRFIAKDSNRVEDETVARLRNYHEDEPSPAPGKPFDGPDEEEGNDVEQRVEDMREMAGSEARRPTSEEAQRARPKNANAAQAAASTGSARAAQESVEQTETITIRDGQGSFAVAIPKQARQGRSGSRQRTRGASESGTPGLRPRLSWSQFESVIGAADLEEERAQYLRERRSRQRGSNRSQEWKRFRAAIENFVPNVRPGNQTALNAAASPFAEYIAAVHRRLHREFADRFLAGLPSMGSSPFSDPTLQTKLEIILSRDGRVHRIGIVRTSGFLPFDHGAFAAVMRGQPYPEAPAAILSGDGRVYLHWGFYRNERQCGTFNAEPFILPNPPGAPSGPGGPLQDQPEWGGVVPTGNPPERPAPEPASPLREEEQKTPARKPDPEPFVPTQQSGQAFG